ncbi:recombinase family protein [Paracoccus denitrificans]|uniref:Resolvase, N-terminal domain n=2 Tax=Paracoccus denitrificans TaxID=266 RepID=A1AY68_PARDP|nr:recombinase family protein [Paracoccus denitrificans]ABL68212.1 Resolvase, N-terminal domain [Paracoccus denitrificans PD1222]MCU7430838.1 recombinase family protein [Paracoccus denitrificans]QAR27510.1 recombinase family protein [Paracoccus denitrificans]UPV95240.1 recombinase family protein [Paracoccus denitrificans]GEK71196.1 invertase [Paracoccus denitrificans]
MKVGYARVSTEDQKLDLQIAALRRAGCQKIFKDRGISGSSMERPGMKSMLRSLRPGQTLVVWRLDRLGRSLSGLVLLIEELGERGVEFQSLCESLDTASSGGRLVFHIMAALAEFERSLISERTKAGMQEARDRGLRLGRPPSMTRDQVAEAMRESGKLPIKEVAVRYNVSPRTLRRHLRQLRQCNELA